MACWRHWEAWSIGRDSVVMAVQVGVVGYYSCSQNLSVPYSGRKVFCMADVTNMVNLLLYFRWINCLYVWLCCTLEEDLFRSKHCVIQVLNLGQRTLAHFDYSYLLCTALSPLLQAQIIAHKRHYLISIQLILWSCRLAFQSISVEWSIFYVCCLWSLWVESAVSSVVDFCFHLFFLDFSDFHREKTNLIAML